VRRFSTVVRGWALAATVAGGLLIVPAAARAELALGVIDDENAAERQGSFYADVAALNVSVVRFDLLWSGAATRRPVHPADPADPAYDWAVDDAFVRGTVGRHVTTMFTLMRTPSWARLVPAWDHPFSVPRVPALAAFATAAAIRYSGSFDPDGAGPLTTLPRVTRWEIWNEPALRTTNLFFKSKLGASRDTAVAAGYYAPMLRAAYAAIHAVGKRLGFRETVAGCSCARAHTLAFLQALRPLLGSAPPWDVVSVHPYSSAPQLGAADGSYATIGTHAPDIAVGNFGSFVRELDRLWPGRRDRIWVTEYGWQSYPDERLGVPPWQQALFLTEAISTFRRSYPRVDVLVNFLIQDEPTDRVAGWQSGLRFVDGRKKPAYDAYAASALP